MTVLKYPGSKQQCASWIVDHFPENYRKMTYLEPYFGSGAVYFRKSRSVIETINDLDRYVTNLFYQIRDHPAELIHAIEYTPWSREEYERSKLLVNDSGLETARQFLVRSWMSIGARSNKGYYGWRNNIAGNNGNQSAWYTRLPEIIALTADRLKSISGYIVQIENQDALYLIERHSRTNVLMYLDPPYLLSTRGGRIYNREYSDDDHYQLLQYIKRSKASVIISGYDSELYNAELKHWWKGTKPVRTESGQIKTECIWLNYLPPARLAFDEEYEN